MRNLKYGVLALAPLLGAGGFSQGLNLGMNDGLILQAQAPSQTEAPSQTGSYGSMNGGGRPEAGRQPDADQAGTHMGGAVESHAPAPVAGGLKTTSPRAQAKTQTRKGEKKPKDIRTN